MAGSELTGQGDEALLLAEATRRAHEVITTGVEVVDLAEQIAGAPLIEPSEKRDETTLPPGMVPTPAKERAIRGALFEIGIGMTKDRDLEAAGLPEDAAVLLEWGQEHKGEAEKQKLGGKGPLFFSGTRLRNIAGAERSLTARLFHDEDETAVGETEYDEMRQHGIPTLDSFEAFDEPVEVGRVKWDGTIGDDEEFGTLLQVGTYQDGQPVYAFDVPRKYQYEDGEPVLDAKGRHQFKQPSAAEQLVAFAQLVPFEAGAVATSSTYYPSRYVESVRAVYAGIKNGMRVPQQVEVLAYCPQTLAEVKQEAQPAVPGLAHILGEAYRTRLMLTGLQAELAPPEDTEA